jgi:glycosyltransferase involved in cell wall biosynthesis
LENPKGITKDILDSWHKEGAIEYLGYSKDVRQYIADATCIVLPSYREGKGMTLIEAGAMGKPLIATNVPGCRDIVKNGYNGFLCEMKNSQSLADCIGRFIILDENIKLKFGENSKIFMKENFDEEIIIKMYDNFLNKELP